MGEEDKCQGQICFYLSFVSLLNDFTFLVVILQTQEVTGSLANAKEVSIYAVNSV